MNSRHHLLTAAFVLLLLPYALFASDWPQWRGPKRDGFWPEPIPAGKLAIQWRHPVGWGWSSPVIAHGHVFVTDSELLNHTAKERIHCLEEQTGKSLWSYDYAVTYPDWVFSPGQEFGPIATPLVEQDRLYTVGINGHIHCLDARTGKVLWEQDMQQRYKLRKMMCRGSPLIDGNLLIVVIGGKPGACVVALDKRTGKEIWKALEEPPANSSPIVLTAGGKRQLIVWTDAAVTSLNPLTGETWWRLQMVTSNNDSIATPVVQKNLLLVSGLMLRLDEHKPAVSVLWPEKLAASKRILSNTSTALLRGNHVFSARSSGELVCLEATTGKQIWRTNSVTEIENGASINITLCKNAILMFTDQGDLIHANLTPQGYREISRTHLLDPTWPFSGRKYAWSPPSYANRHVFVRNEKELVCASFDKKP